MDVPDGQQTSQLLEQLEREAEERGLTTEEYLLDTPGEALVTRGS